MLVDFGVARLWRSGRTGQLDLKELPGTGQVDWSGLDALPQVTSITWRGPDRGLIDVLRHRPLVFELEWHDPPSTVDLSGTRLGSVELHGNPVEELRLPDGVHGLRLGCAARVTARERGRLISLGLNGPDLPTGLERVRRLHWKVSGKADTASLRSRHPPAPGSPRRSAIFKNLEILQRVRERGRRFPQPPRRAPAPRVRIRGAKVDAWLAANVDNPLRDWVDGHERGGQQACKAYTKALKRIDKDPQMAQTSLQDFVEELNAIDERYEIIDTVRREEAWDVFMGLAAKAGIDTETASDWFDDWRDF